MGTYQNRTKDFKEPVVHKTVRDTFMGSVVRMHNQYPGNSPLDENKSRTNYDLSVLMTEYLEGVGDAESGDDELEASRRLHDFLLYMTIEDK